MVGLMSSEANGAAAPATNSRRWPRRAVLIIGLMVLFAVLLRLGFWQLSRASYKDDLNSRFIHNEAQPAAPPALLLEDADPELWQFRRTLAEGEFDVHRQYLLDNRTHAGRAGYHVLSVLKIPQGAVLVNRGWLAVGPDRSRLPDLPLAAGPVTIAGRLVPTPADGLLLGDTGYGSNGWPKVVQNVDLQEIGRQHGELLLPAMIVLDPSDEACQTCRWQAIAGIGADRHRGYAVQWFSLAGALAVLLTITGWKGWRRARQ